MRLCVTLIFFVLHIVPVPLHRHPSLCLLVMLFVSCSIAAANTEPQDFYLPGALGVVRTEITAPAAPVNLDVYVPADDGRYPVVVFFHGFTASRRYYETILEHVAGHGFVVVAPQMYRPDCYGCAPLPAMEALRGLRLLIWVQRNLSEHVSAKVKTQSIGLAGQSRGGQIVFRIALRTGSTVCAAALIDPVDGLAMFGQTRITRRNRTLTIPALVLGTGLGPRMPDNATFPLPCAPPDIGHEAFYAACAGPAWHAIALDYGHTDMLDEEDFTPGVCPGGPDRDAMRAFTAGMMAAFFSLILQENDSAAAVLDDPALAPIACTLEQKQTAASTAGCFTEEACP